MIDYFTVLTNYVKMVLLMNRVESKSLLLSLFNLVYTRVNSTSEPNILRVHQSLFRDFDSKIAFDTFRDRFVSMQTHTGKALLSLIPAFDRGLTQYLTNKRPLEMLSEPDKIPYPSVDSTYIYLTLHEQMCEWIVYTFICCPDALGMAPGSTNNNILSANSNKQSSGGGGLLAKFKKEEVKEVRSYELLLMKVLEQSYVMRIYGDEYLFVHEPYDDLTKKYKTGFMNLKKERKSLENAMQVSAQNSQDVHMQKRSYLLLQLRSLLNMMRDSPGLLGPKFQLVLATLSLSKMEIMWYFRHLGVQPKFSTKKFKDIRDPNIGEMIYLVDELISVCLLHREVIQAYHRKILKNLYHKKVSELWQNAKRWFEGQVPTVFESILSDLDNSLSIANFHSMRLNWKRLEAYLTGFQFKQALSDTSVREMFITMCKVYLFSRHVDEVEIQLSEQASIKELYYYHKQVYDMYKSGLEGEMRQPLFSISFIRILDYYPENIHKTLNPELRKQVGAQAVELANEMLELLSETIKQKLDELRGDKGHASLAKQLTGAEKAELFKFLMLKEQYSNKDKAKDLEKKPGYESYHQERETIKYMRMLEKNFTQLLFTLGRYDEIAIFDTVYYPTEFLRNRLESYIDSFVGSVALKVPAMPNPKEKAKNLEFPTPTSILSELTSFMITLKLVEQCVRVKTEDLVMAAFLKHFVNLKYIGSPYEVDRQKHVHDNAIISYARWYTDLISNANIKYKLLYARPKKTFVSTPATPIISFNGEEYLGMPELTALCTLVGPFGVRVLDQHLLDELYNLAEQLQTVLSTHVKDLKDVESSLYSDNVIKGLDKKFKGLEKLMELCISIGGILAFRRNLHEALEDVVRQNIPIIYKVIHAAHKQYEENVFMDNKFLLIDEMATDCGIPANNADSALKIRLSRMAENSAAWEMLPVAFSVLLTCTPLWKDNDYNTEIEGWTNNAHLAIDCFNQLLVAIFTVKSSERIVIEQMYEKFAECAAILLLNLRSQKGADKTVDSCYIFADKLVQEAPFMHTSIFEELTPYSMLRPIYRQAYEGANN